MFIKIMLEQDNAYFMSKYKIIILMYLLQCIIYTYVKYLVLESVALRRSFLKYHSCVYYSKSKTQIGKKKI